MKNMGMQAITHISAMIMGISPREVLLIVIITAVVAYLAGKKMKKNK